MSEDAGTPQSRYAGYPAAVVFAAESGAGALDQLLWGREVFVTGEARQGRLPVRVPRGTFKPLDGWIDEGSLQDTPVLEVVFVDIGQGDGALVVTPDGRRLLVDAGRSDNMIRFLHWRFHGFKSLEQFDTLVLSHGDLDHYGGMTKIFEQRNLRFTNLVHNGLVERESPRESDRLGRRVTVGATTYVTGLTDTHARLHALLADPATQAPVYAGVLRSALATGGVTRAVMAGLRADRPERVYLKGYEANTPIAIEVLGPLIEKAGRAKALRWLGDVGKTKNGHSVVLRLVMGRVSLLLSGDLNSAAEGLLLSHFSQQTYPPADAAARDAMVLAARQWLRCDVAKACHHGSSDFTDLFLRAIDPIAVIVSSGDAEPYAHPRADALGTYGKSGRGDRPLVFSTEIARSTSEVVKNSAVFKKQLTTLVGRISKASQEGNAAALASAEKAFQAKLADIKRSVDVYGAINFRTDGVRALVAYKIEAPLKKSNKWDIYCLEPDADGALRYRSKHQPPD